MKLKITIIIFTLALLLRFWNLQNLLTFTLDEELEAFIVKNIVTGHHFPAIGISVAPVGIHLTPLFYYLAALPFALGALNPIIWGLAAVIIGAITSILVLIYVSKFVNKVTGIFAGLVYTFSFLVVMYDKHFWNVTPMPLVALLTLISLYQILKNKQSYLILLGLALSLGLSSHLSTVSLLILSVLVLFPNLKKLDKRLLLSNFGILALTHIPLLIFELRHNFSQSRALLSSFTGEHSAINLNRIIDNLLLLPKFASRLVYTFGNHDFAREHTYGYFEILARDSRIPIVFLVAMSFLLLFAVYKLIRSTNLFLNLSGTLLVITLFSLVVYSLIFKGSLFEFYLNLCIPSLCIAFGYLLSIWFTQNKFSRLAVLTIFIVFIVLNIHASLTSTHSYGFATKLRIINWVADHLPENTPYELHSIGYGHKYEGYRYLFEHFYRPPVKSYVDPQLSWTYQDPVTDTAEFMVVITSFEPAYIAEIASERAKYSPHSIESAQFGEINVFIIPVINKIQAALR